MRVDRSRYKPSLNWRTLERLAIQPCAEARHDGLHGSRIIALSRSTREHASYRLNPDFTQLPVLPRSLPLRDVRAVACTGAIRN